MKITITFEIADEDADADHVTGCTDDFYSALFAALIPYGHDIDIRRAA
jgi:hypothetical protein